MLSLPERGAVLNVCLASDLDRLTPAHAGNSSARFVSMVSISVHPRACGEQINALTPLDAFPGSSPRMRGTGQPDPHRPGRPRFIPAHAGNRLALLSWAMPCAVHPRACGEQMTHLRPIDAAPGSSPRMRGTAVMDAFRHRVGRFIPAHAGNRRSGTDRGCYCSVHPRACGEQFSSASRTMPVVGSSPRMRGTAHRRRHHGNAVRFIPAHAGNSHRCRSSSNPFPVHPRACGEQYPRRRMMSTDDGSSPRMRGTAFQRPLP